MPKATETHNIIASGDNSLARKLWTDPQIARPSALFRAYLEQRQYVADNEEAASAQEIVGEDETPLDRLLEPLNAIVDAIINRETTTAVDVAELAVVLRDRLYVPGRNELHSEADESKLTPLLIAALAIADRSTH